ncbi:MAG: hypothetical protein KJO07_17460 [Deltaproteobacteria bacterium]|jgi:hypothetical protein|nr:hypothetical protein [Deltaproteobacteria bacterium]
MLFGCGQCGAELKVEAHIKTTICPYCDAPSVVERPASAARPDPVFVVGFVVQQGNAAELVKNWLGSRSIFSHSGIKKARLEKTRSIYLPAYLYGATAHSRYSADIGEEYTVTETYTDSQGKTRTRTRTETEWRHLSGVHACYVSDRIVTASRGLPNQELEAVEPFDLRAIRRYSPAMISGWVSEEPSIPQDECFRMAHQEAVDYVGRSLSAFMPGDKHRNLQYTTNFDNEHIELVLLPMWVFSARYHPEKPPVRLCVNGQTGEVGGKVPLSWIKITIAILIGLAAIVALVIVLSQS